MKGLDNEKMRSMKLKQRNMIQSITTKIILDSIADGVFTVDRDWKITSFNRAAERITGITFTKAIGQKCFDVFHANICQTACALRETLKTGEEIIDRPVNILDHDGRVIPVSISTAVLKDEKHNIIGGVETFRDLSPLEALKKEISRQYSVNDIISKNHEIREIFDILSDIAESDSTVLIYGESGTGKELFARAIHNLSRRKKFPFVAINCGALPDNLLESELFGYKKGAFTDAGKDKPGRFAIADGGTIFLDEIGDLPLFLQSKLLRVLQEKEYEPLGATSSVKANVRIIAATNKNLQEMIIREKFREDLFYRLNIVKLELPPLRRRKEDVPLLVEHFIKKLNLRKGKNIPGISDGALQLLMTYDFPGNIRELENLLEHAFVMCRSGEIRSEHLPVEFRNAVSLPKTCVDDISLRVRFKKSEAEIIRDVLKRNHGHRGRTARELGIDSSTLWRKMKKLGITDS